MNSKLKKALEFLTHEGIEPPLLLVEVVIYDEEYRGTGGFRYHLFYEGCIPISKFLEIDRWPEDLSWAQIRTRNAARIRLFRIPRFISREGKIISPSPWYTARGNLAEDTIIPASAVQQIKKEAARHSKGRPLAKELEDGSMTLL